MTPTPEHRVTGKSLKRLKAQCKCVADAENGVERALANVTRADAQAQQLVNEARQAVQQAQERLARARQAGVELQERLAGLAGVPLGVEVHEIDERTGEVRVKPQPRRRRNR